MGDVVKVIGRNTTLNSKIKHGDICVVTNTQSDGVELNNTADGWMHDFDIELAEDTSKPETATHEGNVYETGKHYLFSDDGVKWYAGNLVSLDSEHEYLFRWDACGFKKIKELAASSLGTITPAPIELIDGNAYMFNPHNTTLLDVIGLYEKKTNQFYCNGWSIILAHCSIIRPMTVAESK